MKTNVHLVCRRLLSPALLSWFVWLAVLVLFLAGCGAQQSPESGVSGEEAEAGDGVKADSDMTKWEREALEPFETLMTPLIEEGYVPGFVVVVVDGDRSVIHGYGHVSWESDAVPNANSIYEIGSITKTFTALLLADLAETGQLTLDDSIEQHLPDGVGVPAAPEPSILEKFVPGSGDEEKDATITLTHLSTHTSGLPRMPSNFDPPDPSNPYESYTSEDLYAFLGEHTLANWPGEEWEYSNFGVGLLGHLLGRVHGGGYEAALKERVLEPLGMQDTWFQVPADEAQRFVPGHSLSGDVAGYWDFDVLAGAGALRSTGNDMRLYLQAMLAADDEPSGTSTLQKAALVTFEPRVESKLDGWSNGLGWSISEDGQKLRHDGGTYGFYASLGFDREANRGFVVLTNGALWRVSPLGDGLRKILLGEEVAPVELRDSVEVPAETLEKYVGVYQLAPGVSLEITLEDGGRLGLKEPGSPSGTLLFAESESRFWMMEDESVIFAFEVDEDGKVVMVLEQGGVEQVRGKRVEE